VIEAYEKLEELMGRIISYAGLAYFTNTSDPATPSSMAMCKAR
jgi:oligoendopeptidase F